MPDGVLRRRYRHRMIADLGLDALHRARHVALHAGASRASFGVVCVGGERLAYALVTPRAEGVGIRPQLRIAFDLRLVRRRMTRRAGQAALQVALALPQSECIVRESPRAPIRPVRRILIHRLRGLQDRQEVVVIILARGEPQGVDVAEGVALRAHHGIALRVQPGLQHDVARRTLRRHGRAVVRHVLASRTVAALAVGAEILPRRLIGVARVVVPLLLTAHVARETVLVPHLNQHFAGLVRIRDIEVVEPLLAQHIPTRRQHDHAPGGERGQVVLDAPVPQRVIHPVLLRLSGEGGFGDVVDSVALAQGVGCAAQLQLRAREVPFDAGPGRRLHHLAVPGLRPFGVDFRVTLRARRGPCIPRAGGRVRRNHHGPDQQYPSRGHPSG